MKKLLIKNSTIINGGKSVLGDVLIENDIITQISETGIQSSEAEIIEAKGLYLFPGIIDDQVHFREPGLTNKGEIYTESRAAAAGGVTSYMEMPNTKPQTTTQAELAKKYAIGAEKSLVNYSFYIGATNDNIDELLKTDPLNVPGIKVFMGSSTGNMLVDNEITLNKIFSQTPLLIATHCEDESIIQLNTQKYKAEFGDDIPFSYHPIIRDAKACYKSSSFAVKLAKKHNSRLHILHISSAKELDLFENNIDRKAKKITSEVCVHHLWFNSDDYDKFGSRIKWNPSVKHKVDQEALFAALLNGILDVIATDHAPHTIDEKNNKYFEAPSGGPLIQHSLQAMLEFYHRGMISLEQIADKMCHAPADIYQVKNRGYIKEGYYADLVLVDLNKPQLVSKENLFYKCKWSPFEEMQFKSSVVSTFVNGGCVYHNGKILEAKVAKALKFDR